MDLALDHAAAGGKGLLDVMHIQGRLQIDIHAIPRIIGQGAGIGLPWKIDQDHIALGFPAADACIEIEKFILAQVAGHQGAESILHAHIVPGDGGVTLIIDTVNILQIVPMGPLTEEAIK